MSQLGPGGWDLPKRKEDSPTSDSPGDRATINVMVDGHYYAHVVYTHDQAEAERTVQAIHRALTGEKPEQIKVSHFFPHPAEV